MRFAGAPRVTSSLRAARADAARAPTEPVVARVVEVGVLVAIVAVTVQTVAHLANVFALDGRFEQLDADAEGTTFAWASSVAIFTGAVAAFLHAALYAHRRRELTVVALILAFLSLDEIVQVHERIGLAVGTDALGLPSYVGVRFWLLFYAPLLLVLAALLWRCANDLPARARLVSVYGVASLVAAVALEALGFPTKWLDERGVGWPDDLRIAAEEATELAGWILVAAGLVAGLCGALARNQVPSARDT